MIVVDASVLIALFDPGDALHAAAQRLLAEQVDEDLLVHVVTKAEVLVGPARTDRSSTVERRLDAVGVRTTDLPASDAAELARLPARTGLRLPDCCVLLAAERAGAAVATFDERLARGAAALGIPVLG